MNCKRFGLLALAFCSLILFFSKHSDAADKPNFVLIFIDDMGYGDIGPFGSKLNNTPHLDRMAKEGMKLTSFYAAPVCSASRAQLLTGSYAPRVSVPGVFFPAGSRGLNPKEHTVADYLRESGYATMCVGKWHVGDQREFLPTNNGFDAYFGIPYSNDMARTSEDGRAVHPLMRDTEVAELLENEGQRRITREYTEEGIRFITKNKDKPFFLYLPHTAMHVPLYPHKDFVGKSKNGTYGDWVEEVDWSVGQILGALKELKLEENTLVIFTSDNGPWASKGKNGGVSGPLRGSKGCTLEGGVREPTIIHWPGKVKAGSSNDTIAGTTDILPTFVSLAGGKLKKGIKIDGVDISPVLLGQAEESTREAWYYYKGTQLKAVRSGPWKLALGPQTLGMGIRQRDKDLQVKGVRLYNLDKEIGEKTNVASDNPEVVAKLRKLADKMIADIGSGKAGPGVRPVGVVKNPVLLYPTKKRAPRKPVKKSGAAAISKPIDWSKVSVGQVYDPSVAPQIAGRPFEIECAVKAKGNKPVQGVIVAHGGSAVGYSLYVNQGQLVFAVRTSSDSISRVKVKWPANSIAAVSASLSKEGVMSLQINDGKAASLPPGELLGKHPQESFCVGHDDLNPVDTASPGGQLVGEVSKLKVTIEKK
jgi:arylsulfatase A